MTGNFQGIGMTSQRSRDRLIDQLREMGIKSEPVLAAMRNTPRHIFVDEALASRAYDNIALPIGHNQTISQPYVVARMTEALVGKKQVKKVLEVGTGCGYQTAILAQLAAQVFSIERINTLLSGARERFHTLQYRNVKAKYGDGNKGWPEQAPFQGILVSAAPTSIPETLLEQLAMGGRMIIPIGLSGAQQLLSITRTDAGFVEKKLDMVSFVPMLGGRN